jgi:hypothetical protein
MSVVLRHHFKEKEMDVKLREQPWKGPVGIQ